MIDMYQIFIHDEFSKFEFSIINYCEMKQFFFLNYDVIMQKKIINLNDFESFANENFFTSFDSSNDEIDESSFSYIKQLIEKMKAFKAT
jgi:hypothetical protein